MRMKSPSDLARTARTLRFLWPSQLAWRGRYFLERRRPARASTWRWPDASRAPRLRADLPHVPTLHTRCIHLTDVAQLLERGELTLLGQTRTLGLAEPDWRLGPITEGRLWAISLHYLAWLHDLAEIAAGPTTQSEPAWQLCRTLLGSWIARCTVDAPGARDLAWNAYAIATRLGWMVRAHEILQPRWASAQALDREIRETLWAQAHYLHRHLEWDLRANHLLRDAIGLAWAGRFFDEPAARRWLDAADELGLAQAEEQVLADGAHFERSPMYHLHAMEDLLTLACLTEREPVRRRLTEIWRGMAEYARWMRHPDGEIPLFNDAALGGAPSPTAVLEAGTHLGVPIRDVARGTRHFPDVGMLAHHGSEWTIFADVGTVGPAYQPGHAHASTLTLEASFGDRRLFVDAGTFAYDHDARRRYERSTDAHNTVALDGVDSSEVWHIFRVGRRARARVNQLDTAGVLRAIVEHDGYRHLPGSLVHERELHCDGPRLEVVDRVEGTGTHMAVGGWLLDPRWAAQRTERGWVLTSQGHRLELHVTGAGVERFDESRAYFPRQGSEERTTRLCWRVRAALPLLVVTTVAPL